MNDKNSCLVPPTHDAEPSTDRERPPSTYRPVHDYRSWSARTKSSAPPDAPLHPSGRQRLRQLIERAECRWQDYEIAGQRARYVDKIDDIDGQGLCWIVGTTLVDLPLKPDVLQHMSRRIFHHDLPPRTAPGREAEDPLVVLEDGSGRLRLTGALLNEAFLVTGVHLAALGWENHLGTFEVIDTLVAGPPPQPQRRRCDSGGHPAQSPATNDGGETRHKQVAFVSGLNISDAAVDLLQLSLLKEYLLGESLCHSDQESATFITRLVIVGNSIAADISDDIAADETPRRRPREQKYGFDAASYNPSAMAQLDAWLSEVLPTLPVTLMPGDFDLTNHNLPQQPVSLALLPRARCYSSAQTTPAAQGTEPGWFDSVTNPWESEIDGWRMLGNSGQPVDDVLKYIDWGGSDGQAADGRLEVMASMVRWGSSAPTARRVTYAGQYVNPDLFVLWECPHVYFAGNQPRFDTTVMEGPEGQRVRLFTIPRFCETGEIVLLDMNTLGCSIVKIEVWDEVDSPT